ncbi:hypothetical protein ACFC09_29445 [Streptomyces sp. NPDC056161]
MEHTADVPESIARSADPAQANDYDSFAEAYSVTTRPCTRST